MAAVEIIIGLVCSPTHSLTLAASPVNKQWAPSTPREIEFWRGFYHCMCGQVIRRIIYASADCNGSDWMPAGVIAWRCISAHPGHQEAAINRPVECIIIATGQIIRPDSGLCLFTCVCPNTAFVDGHTHALFTFPDRLSHYCAFWEKANQCQQPGFQGLSESPSQKQLLSGRNLMDWVISICALATRFSLYCINLISLFTTHFFLGSVNALIIKARERQRVFVRGGSDKMSIYVNVPLPGNCCSL